MNLTNLLNIVSKVSKVSIKDIKGKSSKADYVAARAIFAKLAKQIDSNNNLSTIGREINKNHSTIIHYLHNWDTFSSYSYIYDAILLELKDFIVSDTDIVNWIELNIENYYLELIYVKNIRDYIKVKIFEEKLTKIKKL